MKCLVKNCFNHPGKFKPGISFHRLPKCQTKMKVWLDNLGWKQRTQPSRYSIVCSDHFASDSFYYGKNSNKKSRLNDNAVPKILGKRYYDGGGDRFRYVNNEHYNREKEKNSETDVNYQKTSGSASQRPKVNKTYSKNPVDANSTAPLPVANKTPLNQSSSTLNKNETLLATNTPEKISEQILVQLSNLDKTNLKSIINNSNAKFESALQAQARIKFRSELRKKLRNFNLNRNQSVNNVTLNSMIDSGMISTDVLKKIEDVFKLDIFQGNEIYEEVSEVIEDEDDNELMSNDVLSDTYMLLVKYGLIPSVLPIPEQSETIGETDKTNNNDLTETTRIINMDPDPTRPAVHESEAIIINVDELPTVPRVYEDSASNITNDDVILIEPRREIITIGSPDHDSPEDELICDETLELLPVSSELENHQVLNNDCQDGSEETRNVPETEEGCSTFLRSSLLAENYLSSSILTIIKEYNDNLQKCYIEKKEIDSTISALQSKRDSLENTIAQIQASQTQFLELFLRKSNLTLNEIVASSSEMPQRKRRLSTNSSISSQETSRQRRCEILETNGNSIDSTVITISHFDQSSTTSTTSKDHTRNHSNDVKDIIKTNDYLVVSAGVEILRYSSINLELEKVYKRHRALVTGVYVLNNEYVFSVSLDMNLHKFSLEGFQNPLSTHCFKESLTALEYGWNTLFIGSARGRIIAFNIETNKIGLDFHGDVKNSINTLKSIEVSNKKYLTVLTNKSLQLYICDAQKGSIIKTIETFNYINDISIDNDYIYCGLNSNELLTFSIFSGRSHNPKELDTKSTIKCVKIYKNLVLVGCVDGYIHVYHKSTNLYLDLVRITDKGLICFEVYPRKIVFSSGDKSLTINDMPQQIAIYLE